MWIHLRSQLGNYVRAVNGGGDAVDVTASTASIWETFLITNNAHSAFASPFGWGPLQLVSGLPVWLCTMANPWLLRRTGTTARADGDPSLWPLQPDTGWTLVKMNGNSIANDGAPIVDGDTVALRTGGPQFPPSNPARFQWLNANGGGGSHTNISDWMSVPAAWERFTIVESRTIASVGVPSLSMDMGPLGIGPRPHAKVTVTLSKPAPVGGAILQSHKIPSTSVPPRELSLKPVSETVTVPASAMSADFDFEVTMVPCIDARLQLSGWNVVPTAIERGVSVHRPIVVEVSRASIVGLALNASVMRSGGSGTFTMVLEDGRLAGEGDYQFALGFATGSVVNLAPGQLSDSPWVSRAHGVAPLSASFNLQAGIITASTGGVSAVFEVRRRVGTVVTTIARGCVMMATTP